MYLILYIDSKNKVQELVYTHCPITQFLRIVERNPYGSSHLVHVSARAYRSNMSQSLNAVRNSLQSLAVHQASLFAMGVDNAEEETI